MVVEIVVDSSRNENNEGLHVSSLDLGEANTLTFENSYGYNCHQQTWEKGLQHASQFNVCPLLRIQISMSLNGML